MQRRPPAPPLALALSLSWAYACSGGTVPLGSECAAFARSCDERPQPGDGTDGDGPGEPTDAGEPPREPDARPGSDAGGRDDSGVADAGGGPPDDAGGGTGDAGAGLFPPLENGSLEISSSPPDPGEVHPLSSTQISPWRWCAGSIEAGDDLGGYGPTDGNSFISLSFGAGPGTVVQRLDTRLVEGQRYALAIDVARSENGPGEVRLELIGTDLSCTSSKTLAMTGPLRSDTALGLETFCLTFTAQDDHDHLALRADPLASTAVVYVDNLRFDPTCR